LIKTKSLIAEVQSLSEVVVVPAGTFNCIKIILTEVATETYENEHKSNEKTRIYYICRKYGIIQDDQHILVKQNGSTTNEYFYSDKLLSKNF